MADRLQQTAVPNVLANDPRFGPLATLTERFSRLNLSTLLVYLVDLIGAELLPVLGEQFSLIGDGWELAESDDSRRMMIKRAIELHRYKGTPWAIRELVRSLGLGEIALIERLSGQRRDGSTSRDAIYFHGRPDAWAMYRVILQRPITNDQAAQLRTLLAAYAPARCHLASLEYQAVANRHNGTIRRNGQYNRGSA